MQTRLPFSRLMLFSALLVVQWTGSQLLGQQHGADFAGASGGPAIPADIPAVPRQKEPPTGFVLGPSDVIRVSVWKEQELSQTAVVRPDGKISIPLVGEVMVAGSNILEAQDTIAAKLRTLLTNPQVTVSVLEIHSRQVYITGQIGHPGAYPLSGSMNVLQLIASAGGLTDYAHKKAIYILRANAAQPMHFNYQSVVRGKAQDQNIQLAPGDTVVVP